jgi:hypothetical protein
VYEALSRVEGGFGRIAGLLFTSFDSVVFVHWCLFSRRDNYEDNLSIIGNAQGLFLRR